MDHEIDAAGLILDQVLVLGKSFVKFVRKDSRETEECKKMCEIYKKN